MQMKNDGGQITLFNDRKKRTTVTPEIVEKVIKFRERRFDMEEIAGFTGVSIATVSRILKRNGVPPKRICSGSEPDPEVVQVNKEPAPVAAETSSECIKSQNNYLQGR